MEITKIQQQPRNYHQNCAKQFTINIFNVFQDGGLIHICTDENGPNHKCELINVTEIIQLSRKTSDAVHGNSFLHDRKRKHLFVFMLRRTTSKAVTRLWCLRSSSQSGFSSHFFFLVERFYNLDANINRNDFFSWHLLVFLLFIPWHEE